MAAPIVTDGENPLLKLADEIGLMPAKEVEKDKGWTPDQPPPVTRKKADDVPDFQAFAMTFGGPAAGGKGIVMNTANMTPSDAAGTKKAQRGFHKDGSPRDALESLEDCLNGFCSICR
jgi:hypothetical protein